MVVFVKKMYEKIVGGVTAGSSRPQYVSNLCRRFRTHIWHSGISAIRNAAEDALRSPDNNAAFSERKRTIQSDQMPTAEAFRLFSERTKTMQIVPRCQRE